MHLSLRVYMRLRAICCSSWGMNPAEFEAWADAEMIAAEDVLEAVYLNGSEPFGVNVFNYIYREREFERRRKFEEVKRLVSLLRLETDPEKQEKLKKRITEVNQ